MKVTQSLTECPSWEEMGEKNILPLSSGNFWCPSGSSHWPTITGSQSTRESDEAVHKGETPRKINNIEDSSGWIWGANEEKTQILG